MFEGFETTDIDVAGVRIHVRVAGDGPPVLLLHGYPETGAMWHRVAPALATSHTVVVPDLRGYGDSDRPPSDRSHRAYSKRAMAADQAGLMLELGHPSYAVVGHDRGARVAHRLVLDHPDAVTRVALLDIAPTRHVFGDVDKVLALTYDHWFFLAQENDLPEVLIGGAAEHWLRTKLDHWSGSGAAFDEDVVAEYVRCFDPAAIHASTEDYRAGATIDLVDDDASWEAGDRIGCPTLVLWGAAGLVGLRYDALGVWREYAAAPELVHGQALPGGHFVPRRHRSRRLPRCVRFSDDLSAPAAGTQACRRRTSGVPLVPTSAVGNVAPVTARAIEVVDLTMTYGDLRAVDGVSLEVGEGEFVGILGPNGAGKTTTLETVEGLRRPDSGRVTVLGQPVWPRNSALLPRIGVQLQASSFFERLTAREQIHTFASLYGVGPAAADEWMGRVGLDDKADTRVEQLSGGQAQRLSIACALVHDPEVVFLDEPTAALDPQARRNLWDLLSGLNDSGRTVVLTTHYMDEAEVLCDRVAIMDHGRILRFDSPAALIRGLDAPARITLAPGQLTLDQGRALRGVDDAIEASEGVVLTTRQPATVVSQLADADHLDGVRVHTGTLEDVFLDLTGREYRA